MESNRSYCCLTSKQPDKAGFGSILHWILTIYAVSRRLGIDYVHVPLKNVEHHEYNPGGVKVADKEWNDYIVGNLLPNQYLKNLELNAAEWIDLPVSLESIIQHVSKKSEKNRVFRIDYLGVPFTDHDISLFTNIRKELIENYKNSKHMMNIYI